ncbi:STM4014 family protein [Nocardia flavorosea]|uniref:STM4014 family protein n=1 Tax=Nocardia flavorosea TaxID=53429 RepID=UPI001894D4BD|nr:STM4014 family protein [Nocardia flavorosea]MBF6349308.1 STM4014 family protein [Nocardia flavorosea]
MTAAHNADGYRWVVVGNGANRRVRSFCAAVTESAAVAPRVVEWLDVLRDGGHTFAEDELVRLDSPGEEPGVDRLLRGVTDPTRVEGTARWYRAFGSAVASLRGGIRLDDPAELAVLFDKRLCHARLAAAGVAVPESPTSGRGQPITGWDDIREHLRVPGLRRMFVKIAHGSSASGVLAVEAHPRGPVRATTSVELTAEGALHNSLRVRRYRTEPEIAAIVDRLAPDGLHLERWVPKSTLRGRACDLRVVVVAGRATHIVVRTASVPITNLHLGGSRGDPAAAREAAGQQWHRAIDLAEQAAACFPATLCVGVDLLPTHGWRRFVVGEVNAFGDLLPRTTGLPGTPAAGLDTYAAQVAAAPRWYGAMRTASAPEDVHVPA